MVEGRSAEPLLRVARRPMTRPRVDAIACHAVAPLGRRDCETPTERRSSVTLFPKDRGLLTNCLLFCK